jgi:hypothetical protein
MSAANSYRCPLRKTAMSCGRATIGVLLLALLGCTGTDSTRRTSRGGALPMAPDMLPADYVVLDCFILERPAGDPFFNEYLWKSADKSIVSLEHKVVLDDNGFRVGQIVGTAPERLQELVQSQRSCISGRRRMLATGPPAADQPERPKLDLDPYGPQRHGSFLVKEGKQGKEINVDDVQYYLEVEPGLTSNGRVRLKFTPKVEFGELMRIPYVPPDRSDFAIKSEKRHHLFRSLSWEVTLGANEWLILGGNSDVPDALGYQAFAREDGVNPMQRLLVLRATRSASGMDTALPTREDLVRAGPSPPLALQAAMSPGPRH